MDLVEAAMYGNITAVREALEKGADVNAKDNLDITVLMIASQWGRTATVKLLIEKSADIKPKDIFGRTVLMHATETGRTWAAFMLAKLDRGAKILKSIRIGETMHYLIEAADKGDITAVRDALEKGADINVKDSSGWTALMHASKYGRMEIVKILETAQTH